MLKDVLHVDDYNEIVEFVNLLKKRNININIPLNTQASNILQICCLKTINAEIIDYLLKEGCDPYYKDFRGWTAFDYLSLNELPYAQVLLWPCLKKYIKK